MTHIHNLNPSLRLLGKKLNDKFKVDLEPGPLEDLLRRLEKAEAQSVLRSGKTCLGVCARQNQQSL